MARGGYRPGAGRKKGSKGTHTLAADKAREYTIQRVTSELDPILTAQIEAAKGMYVEVKGKKVYREKPDVQAGKYLLDQTIGKAKETVAVEGLDFTFDK